MQLIVIGVVILLVSIAILIKLFYDNLATRKNFYDENTLVYVLMHELAHAHCDETGHTDKFLEVFDLFLDRAEKLGFYDRSQKPCPCYPRTPQ